MITKLVEKYFNEAFTTLGYGEDLGKVNKSNRPDLCQYQCNDAFQATKKLKCAPQLICDNVIEYVKKHEDYNQVFESVEFVKPGFININLKDEYIASFLNEMTKDERFGIRDIGLGNRIVIDYGGPNVAKPLHVGHLRSAVIGESLKRMLSYAGYYVVGDVHLGDYGLQIGQVIYGLREESPELVYFDENYNGEYPKEAHFTIKDLEEIYPRISKLSKEDEEVKEECRRLTNELHTNNPGLRALWRHIIKVSIDDIKKNYDKLDVHFELWYGESDSEEYIPELMEIIDHKNLAYMSDGAKVIDVREEGDKVEYPPLILQKKDGSYLYATTDLATILQRQKDFNPQSIIYVVDGRQGTHFKQVFRVAKKANLVSEDCTLEHVGFGTMNGKDGKPFKTRDGGTVKLQELLQIIEDELRNNREENRETSNEDLLKLTNSVVKFADLQNHCEKNYIFDLEKFSEFTGKTGPYMLYTVVRINKLVERALEGMENVELKISNDIHSDAEAKLRLKLLELHPTFENAVKERLPHYITEYIFDLATLANSFYQSNHIISEEDMTKKISWIAQLQLTKQILETLLSLLAISVPEKM